MEKNEKVSIKYDAFVKAVRPDSKSTEDTVHLEGFIGESSVPDHFRLYSDASLNEFVEIPTDAVLHAIANSKEESPLGGSKLWIKKSAVYTYGNPAMTNRPQASFLDGDLMQGYMDSMYQPDAGAGMGNMGGGISQPITGCVGPVPQTIISKPIICQKSLLTPCVTKPWSPICNFQTVIKSLCKPCIPITITKGPIVSIADCPSFPCPTPTFKTETINPGGGIGGGGVMSDFSGGSFNPYFDGDLYQGYMDSMYQPDAGAAGMQDGGIGNMGGGISQPITGCVQPTVITINPVVCGGTITSPITRFSPVCPPRRTIIPVLCPTNVNFPPCNFQRTLPWATCPRPTVTRPIFCPITGGGGPIVSIADCPSFPCPTTIQTGTTVINPGGGGIGQQNAGMADPSGGSFNPYFDGDLYQGYMDAMYQQPDASGAGAQAMGGDGGMSPFGPPPTSPIACLQITQNQTICDIRSRLVVCVTRINQFCPTRINQFCPTRDFRISRCIACPPWTWTRPPITTTFPPTTTFTGTRPTGTIFNPGGGIGGGQQFGNDFYGSFDPYSGY
jgi:hypothetical protein